MLKWKNEKNRRAPRRLERVAPTPSVGIVTARMEPKKDRGGFGSDRGSCEPLDEERTRTRGRGVKRENRCWAPSASHARAVGATSQIARAGSAGPWLCRRSLDDGTSGNADQKAVWRELPSGAHESRAQSDQVQRATADRTGYAARRRSHQDMEG